MVELKAVGLLLVSLRFFISFPKGLQFSTVVVRTCQVMFLCCCPTLPFMIVNKLIVVRDFCVFIVHHNDKAMGVLLGI